MADGHDYIAGVIEKGCRVIIAERIVDVPEGITLIVTDDTKKALAIMANNYFEEPATKLKLVGVTGTNGKTTTTTSQSHAGAPGARAAR